MRRSVDHDVERCPCGRPLHYASARIANHMRQQVELHGSTVNVRTSKGIFAMPRHFVVLHSLVISEKNDQQLVAAAQRYRFARVSDVRDKVVH